MIQTSNSEYGAITFLCVYLSPPCSTRGISLSLIYRPLSSIRPGQWLIMPLKEKTIHLRWKAVAHTVLASEILGVSVADAYLRRVLRTSQQTHTVTVNDELRDNDEEKMT